LDCRGRGVSSSAVHICAQNRSVKCVISCLHIAESFVRVRISQLSGWNGRGTVGSIGSVLDLSACIMSQRAVSEFRLDVGSFSLPRYLKRDDDGGGYSVARGVWFKVTLWSKQDDTCTLSIPVPNFSFNTTSSSRQAASHRYTSPDSSSGPPTTSVTSFTLTSACPTIDSFKPTVSIEFPRGQNRHLSAIPYQLYFAPGLQKSVNATKRTSEAPDSPDCVCGWYCPYLSVAEPKQKSDCF
jgi:hypothetical protein